MLTGTVRRWSVSALGLMVLWAVLVVTFAVHFAGRAPDDMFITYRYAWNLAHGEGLVFNPGERVFGLTNPGHALVLALLHTVTRLPVHLLAGVVFAVAFWTLALVVWLDGRRRGAEVEAAVGGTLLLASSYVWATSGSASAIVLALLAVAAHLAERRPVLSGLAAGLSAWYRPDAVLGLVGLAAFIWLERRRPPWRWAFAAGGTVLVGVAAAWYWFGDAVPNTLVAKRVMAAAQVGAAATGDRFWVQAVGPLAKSFGPGWSLLVVLGVAGQWPLFARGGVVVRTLALYGAGVAVAYPLLGVPFFVWYSVPPVVVLVYGASFLGAGVGRAIARGMKDLGESNRAFRRRLGQVLGVAAAGSILILPAVQLARASLVRLGGPVQGGRYDTYREAALWIREHSRAEERIAYGEIGNLAYWSQRPVDDLMGLVTPEALPFVSVGDGLGAFLLRPPDLFVHHPKSPNPGIIRRPWFAHAYRPVARFRAPGDRGEATVYRRRPGAELPPPRHPWAPDRGER